MCLTISFPKRQGLCSSKIHRPLQAPMDPPHLCLTAKFNWWGSLESKCVRTYILNVLLSPRTSQIIQKLNSAPSIGTQCCVHAPVRSCNCFLYSSLSLLSHIITLFMTLSITGFHVHPSGCTDFTDRLHLFVFPGVKLAASKP